MPIACVDGSLATCNYLNRHFFQALTGTTLKYFGNLTTPDRNMILKAALEKKYVYDYGLSKRGKEFSFSTAQSFTEKMSPEYIIFPVLHGKDNGNYKFTVKVWKPSEGKEKVWQKSWRADGEELDFPLTLDLYEKAAFAACEHIIGKKISRNNFPASSRELSSHIQQAESLRKVLTLESEIEAVRLFCKSLRKSPGSARLWAEISETYTILAKNVSATWTKKALETSLRSMVAATIAKKFDPEDSKVKRALYFSASMNYLPVIADERYDEYVSDSDDLIARFSKADNSEKQQKIFNDILKQKPGYSFISQGSVSNEEAINRLNDLWKQCPQSTFVCNALGDKIYNGGEFFKSENYVQIHTFKAQQQFLDYAYRWMKERPDEMHERHEDLVQEIRNVCSSFDISVSDEETSVTRIMEEMKKYYFGRNALYFTEEKLPFQVLKVCRNVQKDMQDYLNNHESFPEQTVDITDSYALDLWQRELLRGPLGALYIVGNKLSVFRVIKKAVPQMVNLYPEDLLVQNLGFNLIYGETGYGPDGDRYLNVMNELDINHPLVISYRMKNYRDGGNINPPKSKALGIIYLASKPGSAQVIKKDYYFFFKLREMKWAQKMAKRYVHCFPDSIWGKRKLVEIKQYIEKRYNTLAELDSIFPDEMTNPYTMWSAAGIYRSNGHFEKGLELFRKAFEQLPDDKDLAHKLGYSWRLAGRPEKYVQTLEIFAKEHKGSLKSCITYNQIGDFYYFQAETEKARKYYNRANRIDSWQGGSIMGRALLCYADGDLEGAKKEIQTNINRYQSDYAPSRFAGMLFKNDEIERAGKYIREKYEECHSPGNYNLRMARAEYYYRTDQRKKLFTDLHHFINIYKPDVDSRAKLAEMYLRVGDFDGCIRLLEKEIPRLSKTHWKMQPLYSRLARAYIMKGDLEAAEEWVDKCRLFALTHKKTFGLLGFYHWKKGNIEKARDYLVMQLNTEPSNTTARACLVGLEREQGNIDKAIEQGEKGMKCCILHDDTELYYQLAKAYLEKGVKKEAKKLTERIIMVDGENSRTGRKLDGLGG